MTSINFAICLIFIALFAACNKQDNNKPAVNHKKSPVQYLRLTGMDGLLILTSGDEKGWHGIINHQNGNVTWVLDSLIGWDEIYGYFPSNIEGTTFFDAGDIFYNYHQVYEG